MTSESVNHLRSVLHKAKGDLDVIARRLESEFASQSVEGAPLHQLLKNVEKLERDVAALETDYRDVQTAKRECLNAARDLVANWTTLQQLKATSGLPSDLDTDVIALTATTEIVEAELVKTPIEIEQQDYLADF